MNKTIYYISIATLALAFTTVCFFLWLAFWPVNVVTVKNLPNPVLTPTVSKGGNLEFHSSYCAYREATAQIIRSLVGSDGSLILLAPYAYTIEPGCVDHDSYVTIPDNVPPGKYRLYTSATYQLNPLHSVFATSVTEQFTVVSHTSQ